MGAIEVLKDNTDEGENLRSEGVKKKVEGFL